MMNGYKPPSNSRMKKEVSMDSISGYFEYTGRDEAKDVEKEVEENYQYVLKTLTDQAVYVPVTYTTKAYIYNPDVVSNVSYNTYLDVMYEEFTVNK